VVKKRGAEDQREKSRARKKKKRYRRPSLDPAGKKEKKRPLILYRTREATLAKKRGRAQFWVHDLSRGRKKKRKNASLFH